MKLRINSNSIRLRLSKTEVATFGATGIINAETDFGTNSLYYVLKKENSVDAICANMTNNTITVFLPTRIADNWVNTDTISLEHKIDLTKGKQLFILVEKDFKCIDNGSGEDQSDNYENPNKNC